MLGMDDPLIDLSAQARALAGSHIEGCNVLRGGTSCDCEHEERANRIESALRSAVQEALEAYGQHSDNCPARYPGAESAGLSCICGLTALRGAP